MRSNGFGWAPQVVPQELYLPLGQRHERGEQVKKRRFPAAIGPQESKNFPLPYLQRYIGEGDPCTIAVPHSCNDDSWLQKRGRRHYGVLRFTIPGHHYPPASHLQQDQRCSRMPAIGHVSGERTPPGKGCKTLSTAPVAASATACPSTPGQKNR